MGSVVIMDADESWELRVPRNEADLEDLWAECRRHGVEPGGHLRVVVPTEEDAEASQRQRFLFAGMGEGPSDLSTNTDAYLAEGFGRS